MLKFSKSKIVSKKLSQLSDFSACVFYSTVSILNCEYKLHWSSKGGEGGRGLISFELHLKVKRYLICFELQRKGEVGLISFLLQGKVGGVGGG